MVKYLLKRPISVFMAFTALLILGVIAYLNVPVSLLPDIDIPKITVKVTGNNISARELENTVVSPLRSNLMQVRHLTDIQSETRDEVGLIHLSFDYGTRTDLSFIEVNEKIDGAMNSLPRKLKRPQVIKANATDLPVFNLNLTLKKATPYGTTDEYSFLELCEVTKNIIKRRLEQLSEVAMVDVTGMVNRQLVIIPNLECMQTLGITLSDLERAISANNVETSSTIVRDGQYEYSIKFSSLLRTPEDVKNIYLKINSQILQLKDIARVEILPEKEKGLSYFNGKRAVTLSIVKQSNEKIANLHKATHDAISVLKEQYPDIEFSTTQDQSKLLDVTIGSLQQDLIMALILICLVALFFMRNLKIPLLITITMIVSLILSILVLYLFHISLNIVSIAGLILSLGIMIDNGIVVTDNITQYREKGHLLDNACIKGTNEIITPMLSSTLTNVAIFLPLIFMSGIAGAIFYDQAVSISLSLFVAYLVAITFLPIFYKIAFSPKYAWSKKEWKLPTSKNDWLFSIYEKGVDFTFAHKKSMIAFILFSIPLCVILFNVIEKEKMPVLDYDEMVVKVDWNEEINVKENADRVNKFIKEMNLNKQLKEAAALVGLQQYLIDRGESQRSSQSKIYLRIEDKKELKILEQNISRYFQTKYPYSIIKFSPPETVFEAIFSTSSPDIVIALYPKDGRQNYSADSLFAFQRDFSRKINNDITGQTFTKQLNLLIDREKLLIYDISYYQIMQKLHTSFSENQFTTLRSYSQYLPVIIGNKTQPVEEVLAETMIRSNNNEFYPLSSFVQIEESITTKEIVSGKNGEYIPFNIAKVKESKGIEQKIKTTLRKYPKWEFNLSGALFQTKSMLNQLVLILLVSILLMYFILAAQFESFLQPLIVFIEIPIDIAASLILLMLCGYTLNLMSAIGIIVTCGVIINDSILKIDVINELRNKGVSLMKAIHEAGKRRLRAILMTAITSMLAFLPLLFSYDMGSELQKPLAIAMIGAMLIGTPVSLFLIPLVYWFIYRKKEEVKNVE